MRGTRYGDFSRWTPGSAGRFSGLLAQQGRVQLDADVNAAHELQADRLRLMMADLLGASCAPAAAPGFGLTPVVALEIDEGNPLVVERAGQAQTIELWLTWCGLAGPLLEWVGGAEEPGLRLSVQRDGRLVLGGSLGAGGRERDLLADEPLMPMRLLHLAMVSVDGAIALFVDGLRVAGADLWDQDQDTGPLGLEMVAGTEHAPLVALVHRVRAWRGARTPMQLARSVAQRPDTPADLADLPDHDWRFANSGEDALIDAVGGCPARLLRGRPRWRVVDLLIGPGRFYVEGVLCEQRTWQSFSEQGDGSGPSFPTHGRHLAYLEVWEETVSAVQDPALLDPALGGLDTTARTRVASRVQLLRLPGREDAPDLDGLLQSAPTTTGAMAAEHVGDHGPGNFLYRVEIHRSGCVAGPSREHPGSAGLDISKPGRPEAGADAAFRIAPAATVFKWSRDNGASLFAVRLADQHDRADTVDLLRSSSGVEPLRPGDLVEPLAYPASLVDAGQPLRRVAEVLEEGTRVRLDGDVAHATGYLRRWDGDRNLTTVETRTGASNWIELEDGIRVRFDEGNYERGDYWWIVSRLDAQTIEWPQRQGHAVALAPAGVTRLRTPLAVVDLDGHARVHDVRRIVDGLAGNAARLGEAPAAPRWPMQPELASEPARNASPDEPDTAESDRDQDDLQPWPADELPRPEPPATDGEPWWNVTPIELPSASVTAVAGSNLGLIALIGADLFVIELDGGSLTWLASLDEARAGVRLASVASTMVMVGGGAQAARPDDRVLGFDLESRRWSELASFPNPASDIALAVHQGQLHAFGGVTGHAVRAARTQRSHFIFDGDQWREDAPLPTGRAGAAAFATDGEIHVVGGSGAGRARLPRPVLETFHAIEGGWTAGHAVPSDGRVIGTFPHAGRHVVLVDEGPAVTLSAFAFLPATRSWEQLPPVPEDVTDVFAAGCADRSMVLARQPGGGALLLELRSDG